MRSRRAAARARWMSTGVGAALALALVAAPAVAQQGPTPGRGMPGVEERISRMTEHLDLTAEQTEKIRPILERQDRQRQQLFEKYGGDRETMRAEMRKLIAEGDEELGEVLTEDQMRKHVEQRQQRMRQGPPGGRAGGPPGR